jgi:ABC-type branched-subunit amino acid transport system substrate-binding protein
MTYRPFQRRDFLRLAILAPLLPFGVKGAARGASLHRELRVGLVLAPGDAALRGARLGGREAERTAALLGGSVTVHEALAAAGTSGLAARQLIARHRVHAIVGGSTAADAEALAAMAAGSETLFMNVGVARETLRNACGPLVFHIAPGSGMRAAAARAAGAPPDARAVSWHPALERFGAAQVSDRYNAAFGEPMAERAWEGWIAMKIIFDATQRAADTGARELAAYLVSRRAVFDGHKGMQLSFHPSTHQLRQPLYIVRGDEVIAEVPVLRGAADVPHAELLDSLDPGGGDACAR